MDESESSGSSENLEIMRIMSNEERMALIETKYAPVSNTKPPLPPPRQLRRSATPSLSVTPTPMNRTFAPADPSATWTPVPPARKRRGSFSSYTSTPSFKD